MYQKTLHSRGTKPLQVRTQNSLYKFINVYNTKHYIKVNIIYINTKHYIHPLNPQRKEHKTLPEERREPAKVEPRPHSSSGRPSQRKNPSQIGHGTQAVPPSQHRKPQASSSDADQWEYQQADDEDTCNL